MESLKFFEILKKIGVYYASVLSADLLLIFKAFGLLTNNSSNSTC
jgi:hypothetical protein